jgi:hypothetical protein
VTIELSPVWLPVATSDWRLRGLRDRHYAGGVGGKTVGQPGRRLAFVTFDGTAGWISHWPDPVYAKHGYGDAYICTLFRKECDGLASEFIDAAIELTEERWGAPPSGGWLTFVDPDKVESPNPGYCFKQAGFQVVGRTKDRDLIVLQRVGGRGRTGRNGALPTTSGEPVRPPQRSGWR